MSRLGKKPFPVPAGVTVTMNDGNITVTGPKGTLSRAFRDEISIKVEDGSILIEPTSDNVFVRSLWGTYASHLRNMVAGVTEGFTKKLILEGVGFKSAVNGTSLDLALGFSHPVNVEIPAGLTVTAEKNVVTITGMDKETVGQFSSYVRSLKKPEPYKGKGFRYDDEVIRRKQGKKSA
jgi:large subunit ribosomal protein L6